LDANAVFAVAPYWLSIRAESHAISVLMDVVVG